jgi:hypothetical protein
MTLRGSPDRGSGSFALARELARGAMGRDVDGYQREFIGLVDRASGLVQAPLATGPLVMP